MSEASDIRIAPVSRTGRPPSAGKDAESLLEEIGVASESGADLILLPQLSFSLYFPARRDRGGLELGERFPSASMEEARRVAGDSWLAASAYQCEGEGVFYVTGELGSKSEGTRLSQRQHHPEAAAGRYEQMFFSPGHEDRRARDLPWCRTGMLIGQDSRCPEAWAALKDDGARLILVSVSETADGWQGIRRVSAGFSAVYGIPVCAVNRAPAPDEPDFAGGSFACDMAGNELTSNEDGQYLLSIPQPWSVEA